MKIHIIIPARYASTRFPGKPLADIYGKPMIIRVVEQCLLAKSCHSVTVATDDERIFNLVNQSGYKVVMTSTQHQSGTDRLAEAIEKLNFADNTYVINVQGDEPYIHPEQIDQVATLLKGGAQIATLVQAIDKKEEYENPNVVKVTFNQFYKALYFSRNPLPYLQKGSFEELVQKKIAWKHIGIYGYSTKILKEISVLPQSSLEQAESLEQLRWLQAGFTIQLATTEFSTYAVDQPEDINKLPENESI